MTIATIQIDFGSAFLPSSTPEVASINVRLTQGPHDMDVQNLAPANPLTVSFNQGPGEYVAIAQAKGAGGENIGDSVSQAVDIPVERLVPVSITQTA